MLTPQERAEEILINATNECSEFIKEKAEKKRKEIEALSKEDLVNLVVKTYALNLAKSEEFKNETGKIMSKLISRDTLGNDRPLSDFVGNSLKKQRSHLVQDIVHVLSSYDKKALDVLVANKVITEEEVNEHINKITFD